ncbi:MAG TPA: hypothetical protein VHJ34_08230, partial [Actinomycetota bacterium]|nr:hypothetical protein [Actinomycetota bacterium]
MPAAAGAQGAVVERAAQALRSDSVYQDSSAERRLGRGELADLRRQIEATGDPIFIAILPSSAGPANAVLRQAARATGRDGTYGVVVGSVFRAGSTTEATGVAPAEASAAIQERRQDGVAAVLEDFVRRSAEPGLQAQGSGRTAPSGGGNDGGGFPWLLVLLLGGAGLLAFRAEQREAFAEVH